MTESEIMKTLECCRGLKIVNVKFFNCEIPLEVTETEKEIFVGDILDLLNRKNAEIELLENESKRQATKAIKEFAERVKKLIVMCYYDLGDLEDTMLLEKDIDQIAKEMGVEL
jgi:hypothetical protein